MVDTLTRTSRKS